MRSTPGRRRGTLLGVLLLVGFDNVAAPLVDNMIQRLIEMVRAFPELPLWMALSAALPVALGAASVAAAAITASSRAGPVVRASMARSSWAVVCAAESCVRMRACPFGTTGKKKPTT